MAFNRSKRTISWDVLPVASQSPKLSASVNVKTCDYLYFAQHSIINSIKIKDE